MANKYLVKMYGLGKYKRANPDSDPLEDFSKMVLAKLHQRDLRTFKHESEGQREKEFFIDSKLYTAWDLDSFKLSEK